jgi:hypothetical protein
LAKELSAISLAVDGAADIVTGTIRVPVDGLNRINDYLDSRVQGKTQEQQEPRIEKIVTKDVKIEKKAMNTEPIDADYKIVEVAI